MIDKKRMQLGMPFGTACGRLKKQLLFSLLLKYKENICYRCGKLIDSSEDLSIEHKIDWLDSSNPKQIFFDTNNIGFSHCKCNYSHASKLYAKTIYFKNKMSLIVSKKYIGELGMAWCGKCKKFKSEELFSRNKCNRNGREWLCISCRKKQRNKHK